jgi:hypothetical protein
LDASVRVTDVPHGTIHDFGMLNAITNEPAATGEVEQDSQMLKLVLSA